MRILLLLMTLSLTSCAFYYGSATLADGTKIRAMSLVANESEAVSARISSPLFQIDFDKNHTDSSSVIESAGGVLDELASPLP